MCAACGVPTHVAVLDPAGNADTAVQGGGQPAKFAALRNPECRRYLLGGGLSMMGDNVDRQVTPASRQMSTFATRAPMHKSTAGGPACGA